MRQFFPARTTGASSAIHEKNFDLVNVNPISLAKRMGTTRWSASAAYPRWPPARWAAGSNPRLS